MAEVKTSPNLTGFYPLKHVVLFKDALSLKSMHGNILMLSELCQPRNKFKHSKHLLYRPLISPLYICILL